MVRKRTETPVIERPTAPSPIEHRDKRATCKTRQMARLQGSSITRTGLSG